MGISCSAVIASNPQLAAGGIEVKGPLQCSAHPIASAGPYFQVSYYPFAVSQALLLPPATTRSQAAGAPSREGD